MSKKKSNKQGATIDEALIEEPVVAKATPGEEVSLKDYHKRSPLSFTAKHYKLLLIGLAVNIIGFILMIGGAATDPNEFNADELFSTTRITIAPMFIVLGYVIIGYAIMKKPKSE